MYTAKAQYLILQNNFMEVAVEPQVYTAETN